VGGHGASSLYDYAACARSRVRVHQSRGDPTATAFGTAATSVYGADDADAAVVLLLEHLGRLGAPDGSIAVPFELAIDDAAIHARVTQLLAGYGIHIRQVWLH
jgi:hypothetical protein